MAAKQLNIRVISIQKTLFEGPASSIVLPGTLGPFEVLPNHAPIISSLEAGTILIRTAGAGEVEIPVHYGVIKVKDNEVTVCVN